MKDFIIKNRIYHKIAVAVLWIFLWQALCLIVNQEILLVSPVRVCERLLKLAGQSEFWISVGASILRIIEGFLMGTLLGTLLAVLTSFVKAANDFLHPVLSVVKATPVASFIILALCWLNREFVPSFIALLMVMPLLWSNVSQGIRETDHRLLEMARVYGFSRAATFRYIYVPSVLSYFMAGATAGMGLAWKAGISAEIFSLPLHAIGTRLYNARIYIETDDVFAYTAVIILLSIVIEKIFIRLMKKLAEHFSAGHVKQGD